MEANSSKVVVAVRIRPLSGEELAAGQKSCCQTMGNIVAIKKDGDGSQYLKSQQLSINEYAYDVVFDENSTQQDVYNRTAKSFIPKVLQGENVTIFAYGATGAGKTHTMLGNTRSDQAAQRADAGIIPNSVRDLFSQISILNKHLQYGESYQVLFSYMEVYNEQVYDLLDNSGSSKVLSVREDQERNIVVVAGLTETLVSDYATVIDLILQGNRQRKTEATMANAVSSRSHAILQLSVRHVSRQNGSGRESYVDSKLSLIDLAGSERASATNNRGVRLQEGANINKSLLALANCINSLSEKAHNSSNNRKSMVINVKYRDSKLTHLLKCSLEGNCNLVMIANLNPSNITYEDSHNTLKYANRAKNIKVNPLVKETSKESTWLEREQRLREENQTLKFSVSQLQMEVKRLRRFQELVMQSGVSLSKTILSLCEENSSIIEADTEIIATENRMSDANTVIPAFDLNYFQNNNNNNNNNNNSNNKSKLSASITSTGVRPLTGRVSVHFAANSSSLQPPTNCEEPDFESTEDNNSAVNSRKRRASHLPVSATMSKRRCSVSSVLSSVNSALSSLSEVTCLSSDLSLKKETNVSSKNNYVTDLKEAHHIKENDEEPATFAVSCDALHSNICVTDETYVSPQDCFANLLSHVQDDLLVTDMSMTEDVHTGIHDDESKNHNDTNDNNNNNNDDIAADEKLQELESLGIFTVQEEETNVTVHGTRQIQDTCDTQDINTHEDTALSHYTDAGEDLSLQSQSQRRSLAYTHRKRSIAKVNAMLDCLSKDVGQLIANSQQIVSQGSENAPVGRRQSVTLRSRHHLQAAPNSVPEQNNLIINNHNNEENYLEKENFEPSIILSDDFVHHNDATNMDAVAAKITARRVTRSMVTTSTTSAASAVNKTTKFEIDSNSQPVMTRRRASLLSQTSSLSENDPAIVGKTASTSNAAVVTGVVKRRKLTLSSRDNFALQNQPVANPFADI